jgi:hypothetical protein
MFSPVSKTNPTVTQIWSGSGTLLQSLRKRYGTWFDIAEMVAMIMFRPHNSSSCPAVVAQLLLLFPRVRMRQQPMLLQLTRPRRLKTAEAAGEAHTDVGAQLVPTQHASRDRPMVARVAGEALLPGVYILENTNTPLLGGGGEKGLDWCMNNAGVRYTRIPDPAHVLSARDGQWGGTKCR